MCCIRLGTSGATHYRATALKHFLPFDLFDAFGFLCVFASLCPLRYCLLPSAEVFARPLFIRRTLEISFRPRLFCPLDYT